MACSWCPCRADWWFYLAGSRSWGSITWIIQSLYFLSCKVDFHKCSTDCSKFLVMRLLPSFFRPRVMFSSVQSTASRKRLGAHLGHSDSRRNLWRRQACLDCTNSAIRDYTGAHLDHWDSRRNLWRQRAYVDTNSAMRETGERETRKYSRLLYFEPESCTLI